MERYIYVYVWSWRAATKRNTTFNLDDELVQRGKAYAAAHGTTLTALVRDHLTKVCHSACNIDPLSWGIGVQN